MDIKKENGEIISISSTKLKNNLFIKEYKNICPYVKNIADNEIKINYLLFKNNVKNTPKIIAYKKKKDKISLFFLKINGTKLSDIKIDCLSLIEKFSLFIKIVKIIKSLHEINIIHNDLKLSNIMVTDDNEIYIIDFDLSTTLKNNNYIVDLYSLSYILYYIFRNDEVIYKIKNTAYNSINDYLNRIRELKNELLLTK